MKQLFTFTTLAIVIFISIAARGKNVLSLPANQLTVNITSGKTYNASPCGRITVSFSNQKRLFKKLRFILTTHGKIGRCQPLQNALIKKYNYYLTRLLAKARHQNRNIDFNYTAGVLEQELLISDRDTTKQFQLTWQLFLKKTKKYVYLSPTKRELVKTLNSLKREVTRQHSLNQTLKAEQRHILAVLKGSSGLTP